MMRTTQGDRSDAIVLIGHGRKALDTPAALIEEFRKEGARAGARTERYIELEQQIRHWPRTSANDPYRVGLQRILEALRHQMPKRRVDLAFNEFCAPSPGEAVAAMAADGVRSIAFVSMMFTPGGHHAERDIPELIEKVRGQYPNIQFRYAWPFPVESIASFLVESLAAAEGKA